VSFLDYVAGLQRVLAQVLQAGLGVAADLQEHSKGATVGYVRGMVRFADGSELHFREYLDTVLSEPRLMYVYHHQDAQRRLIFRYDNAAHDCNLLLNTGPLPDGSINAVDAATLREVGRRIRQNGFPTGTQRPSQNPSAAGPSVG